MDYPTVYEAIKTKQLDSINITSTMVFPTPELVKTIAKHLQDCKVIGATSIGCGQGLLEFLLSEYFKDVVGVDVQEQSEVQQFVLEKMHYRQVTRQGEVVNVPSNHALIFCWGTRAPWQEYIKKYNGNCLVIISDESCDPHPEKEDAKKVLANWKLVSTSSAPSKFKATLYLYKK